jgi:hypothetical protein
MKLGEVVKNTRLGRMKEEIDREVEVLMNRRRTLNNGILDMMICLEEMSNELSEKIEVAIDTL